MIQPSPQAIVFTASLQFAAIPAPQPQPPQYVPPDGAMPQPPLTKPTIKFAQLLHGVLAAQPCHHLPAKSKVQLVKSQSPCTLICNKQLVGVIVSILAAVPADQDV